MAIDKTNLKKQREGRKATIRYATKERMAKVSPKNIEAYNQYLRSNMIKNKDVVKTTFKVYHSNFNIFMAYLAEYYPDFYILDEETMEEDMLDIMEDYMAFLQNDLGNNKKTINNKIAAVSAFYHWAVKRRKIKNHPFANRLDRMKNANDEQIIAVYFLDRDQIDEIVSELSLVDDPEYTDYDKQDQLLWHIAYDSACRIGALHGLTISKLDLDKNKFIDIREKRGKHVNIPFTQETNEMIKQYLQWRKEKGVDCDEFFVAYDYVAGKWHGMSVQAISSRIKKIGYIVGVSDFRAHCIRKTRANEIAKYDLNLAKTLLNHEDVGTTSRFYTEKEDQADVLDKIVELEAKSKHK